MGCPSGGVRVRAGRLRRTGQTNVVLSARAISEVAARQTGWCTDWPRGGGGRAGGWGQQAFGRGRDAHGRAWQRGCHPARSESRAPRGGTVCMRRATSMDGRTPAHTRTADASSSNPYSQCTLYCTVTSTRFARRATCCTLPGAPAPGLGGVGTGGPGVDSSRPGSPPRPTGRGADPIRML